MIYTHLCLKPIMMCTHDAPRIHRSALQVDPGIQDEGSTSTVLSHGYRDKRNDKYHGISTSNDNMQLEPQKNKTEDKALHRYIVINNSEIKYSFGPSKTNDLKTSIDNKRFELKQGEEVEGETKGVKSVDNNNYTSYIERFELDHNENTKELESVDDNNNTYIRHIELNHNEKTKVLESVDDNNNTDVEHIELDHDEETKVLKSVDNNDTNIEPNQLNRKEKTIELESVDDNNDTNIVHTELNHNEKTKGLESVDDNNNTNIEHNELDHNENGKGLKSVGGHNNTDIEHSELNHSKRLESQSSEPLLNIEISDKETPKHNVTLKETPLVAPSMQRNNSTLSQYGDYVSNKSLINTTREGVYLQGFYVSEDLTALEDINGTRLESQKDPHVHMPSEYEFILDEDETYITLPGRSFEISKENVNQSFDLPKSLGFEIQNVSNGDSRDVSYNTTVNRIILGEDLSPTIDESFEIASISDIPENVSSMADRLVVAASTTHLAQNSNISLVDSVTAVTKIETIEDALYKSRLHISQKETLKNVSFEEYLRNNLTLSRNWYKFLNITQLREVLTLGLSVADNDASTIRQNNYSGNDMYTNYTMLIETVSIRPIRVDGLVSVDIEMEGDKSGNTSLHYNEEFSSTISTIIEETLSSQKQTLNENQSIFFDTEKEVIKLDTRNTLSITNLSSDTNQITTMGIELSPYDILHRAAREARSVQDNNSNSDVKDANENNHTGKKATNNHSLFIPSNPGIDFTTDDEMWINVSWGNLDQILKSLSNFGEDSPVMLPLEDSEENIETFMNQRLEDIKTPGKQGYQNMYLEDDEKEEKKEASESGMPLYFYSVTIPSFIAMAVMIILCCVFLRPGGWCCQLFTAQSSTSLVEEEVDAQDMTSKKQTIV
ncbi:unnamed protein product [Timema podura]|uniref:Uncharacterized protein n=1 Tax=Timema podura TaxID=61482 RepID=A0ABN7NGP3_TIMPD|nr:unnamed protein product [Timema podura]